VLVLLSLLFIIPMPPITPIHATHEVDSPRSSFAELVTHRGLFQGLKHFPIRALAARATSAPAGASDLAGPVQHADLQAIVARPGLQRLQAATGALGCPSLDMTVGRLEAEDVGPKPSASIVPGR